MNTGSKRDREREKRRYRKVHIRMWSDEKFKLLSKAHPNAQTLWIYLLTGPHTTIVPGLFSAGELEMAERLGWSIQAFRKCFGELVDHGMAVAEWPAHLVWLPNGLEYGEPDNPNQVKGWAAQLDELPECHLRTVAIQAIRAFLDDLGKGLLGAFDRGFSKAGSGDGFYKSSGNGFGNGSLNGCGNQEQEQEQETETNTCVSVETRAAQFVDRYAALYPLHRRGARYLVRPSMDFQYALKLCATWLDDAYLERLAVLFLTCDHTFAKNGSRTLGQFVALASWCDDQLRQRAAGTPDRSAVPDVNATKAYLASLKAVGE